MIWFWNHYLSGGIDNNNKYICPIRASNHDNLPPAVIISSYFDPLRDEAEMYADKLRGAGGHVTFKCYEDQMHGFLMQRPNIDRAINIYKENVEMLKEYFNV